MSTTNICFGQNRGDFFRRDFYWTKIRTARRLQYELGGEIVFFYHDSDHDSRETRTVLRDPKTNEAQQFNFAIRSRMQRKIRHFTARKLTNAGTSEPHGSYQTMSEKNWCRFSKFWNAKSPTFV